MLFEGWAIDDAPCTVHPFHTPVFKEQREEMQTILGNIQYSLLHAQVGVRKSFLWVLPLPRLLPKPHSPLVLSDCRSSGTVLQVPREPLLVGNLQNCHPASCMRVFAFSNLFLSTSSESRLGECLMFYFCFKLLDMYVVVVVVALENCRRQGY